MPIGLRTIGLGFLFYILFGLLIIYIFFIVWCTYGYFTYIKFNFGRENIILLKFSLLIESLLCPSIYLPKTVGLPTHNMKKLYPLISWTVTCGDRQPILLRPVRARQNQKLKSSSVRPTDAYFSRPFNTLDQDTEADARLLPQAPN